MLHLMLIAQAPGQNEDRKGRMFIGPSGKILDELLDETGIRRDEIYMTNLIKCRLPKNRRPKRDEIETCSCFLEKYGKLRVLVETSKRLPNLYARGRCKIRRYSHVDPPSSNHTI
jgi:DNA polymerase